MKASSYSEKLVELRGSKSRAEVAKAIGVSTSAIAMYERGERVPKDDIKKRIAKYFNKSISSIFYAN
jgi:DNA-binding XRE family transcriptional regulator